MAVLLLCANTCRAQWDVGLGGEIDFPLMYNENVGDYNHSLGAFGPKLSVKYYPNNTTFYPSFSVHATGIHLPLVKSGGSVIGVLCGQINLVFGANVRKVYDNKRELHYGMGIGVSYIDAYDLEITGSAQSTISSYNTDVTNDIIRWIPAVTPHIEYIFPISQEKPLYVGISGQIQYIYFFDDGAEYNVQIVNNQYQAQTLKAVLKGHMVNPGVQLSVYYRFMSRDSY